MVEQCYRTTSTLVNPIIDWTDQEANALVDDFSFVYKGKSISKEALIECREIIHKALEKQIPKKPILKEYGFFGPYPFCPWCDNALINTRNDSWHKEKFCPNCGHALKRSENND